MSFNIGQEYFYIIKLITPTIRAFGEKEFLKRLESYIYNGVDENGDDIFLPVIGKGVYKAMSKTRQKQKSFDHCVKYWYGHILNLNSSEPNTNILFDDYFKNLVLQSQEKHPEIWI